MMKYCIFFVVLCAFSCSGNKYPGVPKRYHMLLSEALSKAGDNAVELNKALDSCDARYKEGVAFLIAYMPERDLKELKAGFLINNVEYAYKARERFSWAKALPDSIFLNEVLPYVSLNENREEWRPDFYGRFSSYVANCQTIWEAIDSVNRNIRDEVRVDYNTKREKPDQSPYESMRQGMASCSGLSILLTDAFRAVGIPARVAGTPNWHDNRGNHNWCEVWVDGQWYFTEYYPNALNKAWFFADAGKAVKGDGQHAIYASSFKPADTYFPLVWDENIRYVHAENVTDRYVDLYKAYESTIKADGRHIPVKVMMFRTGQCMQNSDDRIAANVDVFCGREQMGGGRTAGSTQDMNDALEFLLEKNKTYTFKYTDEKGREKIADVKVKEEPLTVKLYMQ
ncbi:transglutaminase-like domain-containing protein [Odoribacter laneus]|uniref:transglutaminase-like domain-containing protein n=1 Tax=Odoribacter laneus TaxID=626933 RepID=UPI003AB209B9